MAYLKYFPEFTVDGTNDTYIINGSGVTVANASGYYLDAVGAAESFRQQFRLAGVAILASFGVSINVDTGITTLSAGSVFTIVWTDVALRSILGFTGDLSGSTSYVGTYPCQYLWLPSSPGREEYTRPMVERDVAGGRARSGRAFIMRGPSKREKRFWRHRHVSLASAFSPDAPDTSWGWVDPSPTGARGLWDQLCSGAKVRVYPDRSSGDLASYEATYQLDVDYYRSDDMAVEPKMANQYPNLHAYWDAPIALWRAVNASGTPL